jgi:putative PIN family toxin of toxin-antitoxin system
MFGGNPRKILEKVIRGDIELYLSEAIISELGEVLKRPKFGLPISIVNQIISELSSISESVRPSKRINKVKVDPTDNRILECAIEEKAEYIVSWDNHLLDLKEFRSIKIVSPQHFIENSI